MDAQIWLILQFTHAHIRICCLQAFSIMCEPYIRYRYRLSSLKAVMLLFPSGRYAALPQQRKAGGRSGGQSPAAAAWVV